MIDHQIIDAVWAWLPPRPDRRRTVTASIAAAQLGLTPAQVTAALATLRRQGRIAYSRRGQPYKSIGDAECSSTHRD